MPDDITPEPAVTQEPIKSEPIGRPSSFTPAGFAYIRGLRDGYTRAGLPEKVAEVDRDIMDMHRLAMKWGFIWTSPEEEAPHLSDDK